MTLGNDNELKTNNGDCTENKTLGWNMSHNMRILNLTK